MALMRNTARGIVCTGVLLGAAAGLAQEALPPALREMVDAEREFARTAKAKGIRDSFLEYFADDAIAFTPGATSAKARLAKQEPFPFAVHELVWEPRMGDV